MTIIYHIWQHLNQPIVIKFSRLINQRISHFADTH